MRRVLLILLLLSAPVLGKTLFIDGHEVPYKMVEGKQVIRKGDLVEIFPKMAEEDPDETVEVSRLAQHPDARVTKRDGLVTRIKYYNSAAAAIYDGVRADAPKPDNTQAIADTGVSLSVGSRKKTTSPRPDHSAHIYSVTIFNRTENPIRSSTGNLYVVDQDGAQYSCENKENFTIAPGAQASFNGLTFNVPKRDTVKAMHLGNVAKAKL